MNTETPRFYSASINNRPHEGLLRGLPIDILTPEEEVTLARKSDEDARNDLALHNMREAFFYALACARSLPPDEVYSLCYKALSSAARNFKPGRTSRFFAFAKPYIRGEIYRTFKRYKVVTKAETTEIPCEDQDDMARWVLFEHTHDDRYDAFQKATTIEPDFQSIMARDEWASLKPLLAALKEKERMVLQLFYQSGLNFRQIGDLLNVSRSDIQATHANAIKKIRCQVSRKPGLFIR